MHKRLCNFLCFAVSIFIFLRQSPGWGWEGMRALLLIALFRGGVVCVLRGTGEEELEDWEGG